MKYAYLGGPLSVVIARTKHHGPPIDARIALGSDRDSLVSFNVTRNGCDSNREGFPRLAEGPPRNRGVKIRIITVTVTLSEFTRS